MKRFKSMIWLIISMLIFCMNPVWITDAGAEPASLEVVEITPCQDSHWFDLDEFPRAVLSELGTESHYFVSISFSDPDQSIQMTDNAWELILQSGVYAEGGNQTSMIDNEVVVFGQNLSGDEQEDFTDSYILIKDASDGVTTLNIPVEPFRSQTAYHVEIPAGIVSDADETENAALTWRVEMMPVPVISSISPGTVGEDHDNDHPIIIRGNNFNPDGDILVRFNKTRANRVRLRETSTGDGSYLEVYLPRSLDPGLYDITVVNSTHCTKTIPACFSVVEGGDWDFPEDGQQLTHTEHGQKLLQTLLRSENTVEINRSDLSDAETLSLNLDQRLGQSVLVRKVVLEDITRGSNVNVLTDSIWGEVDLYGLNKVDQSASASFSIGRVEPLLKGRLMSQIRPLAILSEPIELVFNNCTAERIQLQIPYDPTEDSDVTILHYSPAQWGWMEEPAVIDPVNRYAQITVTTPGVFVAVQ